MTNLEATKQVVSEIGEKTKYRFTCYLISCCIEGCVVLRENIWILSYGFLYFFFKYILLIMLLQLSHFFSPLSLSALHPTPINIPPALVHVHGLYI